MYTDIIASYLKTLSVGTPLCLCVCVCASVHACERACACVCVCMLHVSMDVHVHGCVLARFILSFFNSNVIFYSDLIYYFTSSGRDFLHYCDVAHKYSEEVILKRRRELLEVLYYRHSICLPIFINGLGPGITKNTA